MRKLLALFFRSLFRIRLLRRYHHACYKYIFRPLDLFRGLDLETCYDDQFRIRVQPAEWIQQHIWFFGLYDPDGIAFLRSRLKPSYTFLDIGANLGTYSLSASAIIDPQQGGRILAFEPVSYIRERLEDNLSMNGCDWVEVHDEALFSSPGELELHVAGGDNIGMSSIHRHDSETGEIEKVRAVRVDDLLRDEGINRVDLVKMDIEGAELEALKGMEACLKEHHPVILIEISTQVLGDRSGQGDDTAAFLRQRGYEMYVLAAEGQLKAHKGQPVPEISNYVFLYTEND